MWRWQFNEVTSNGKWKGAWIFHPGNCRGRSDRTLLTCKLYYHPPREISQHFMFKVSVCIYSIILWSAVTSVSSDEEDRWSFKRSIKALAVCALGQNVYQIIFLIVQKTELTFNLLENVRFRYLLVLCWCSFVRRTANNFLPFPKLYIGFNSSSKVFYHTV